MSEQKVTMAISPSQKKPLCVLLQAAYGVPYDPVLIHAFDEWETGFADDAVRMQGTREQWLKLAEVWNQHHKATSK